MIRIHLLKSVVQSGGCQLNLSSRTFHYKGEKPNHYEILRLRPNCTSRDIKQAYINLSKKYHPDRNNSSDSQHFLSINEAYNVLSKADLRRDYDMVTFPRRKSKKDMNCGYSPRRRNPMDDTAFYWNRDKSQDAYYQSKPYYGIKGLEKMSNSMVLCVCLFVVTVGIALQVLAIRYSVTLRRDELLFQSELANEQLKKSKETAAQNGNKVQLAILEEKFRRRE